jgi:hypothetical protein
MPCGTRTALTDAIRDLDGGRKAPGSSKRGEAIQRLADFVASAPQELRFRDVVINSPLELNGVVRAALSDTEGMGRFAAHFFKRVEERWPRHVAVTLQRYALEFRDSLVQRERASTGGSNPRRPHSPAAILVAAVLQERPGLRSKTFRELVAELRRGETWGDVSIEPGTLTLECRKGWKGSIDVFIPGATLANQSRPRPFKVRSGGRPPKRR